MSEGASASKIPSLEHTLVRALAGHTSIDLSNRMLVFIHLPKCAGRTFSSILDTRFVATRADDEKGCWVRGTLYGQYLGGDKDETLTNLQTVDRSSTYLRGHLPVGVFDEFNRKPAYITMVREPGAQAQSMYRFGVERGGWENGSPVADLVDRGLLIDNPQTRQLAGVKTAKEPCDQSTLDLALNNLKDFVFVGKTEQFERSLQTLLSNLGGPGFLYHSQGLSKLTNLAAEITAQLDMLTQWDRKLYDSIPDISPIDGQPLADIAVDSLVLKPKETAVLSINERDLEDVRKMLEDQGHTLTEKP